MSDRADFTLILQDARGDPWRGRTSIRLENDQERVVYDKEGIYETPITFTGLRAVPRGLHMVHVKTPIHVPASSYLIIRGTAANNRTLRLLIHYEEADTFGDRIPFPAFDDLTRPDLQGLAGVFPERTENLEFRADEERFVRKVTGPVYYSQLIGDKPTHHRRLACLLNLYTKMKVTSIDKSRDMFAWDFVESLFCIEQDRLFARVRPELNTDMPTILKRLEGSDGFDNMSSDTHDIDPPVGFSKYQKTFKSKDSYGNLQLTFARREEGAGQQWVLDADIDEKTGLGHIGEVILHWVTGAKTNPYAVHQLLCLQGHPPPYNLVTELTA